MNVTFTINSVDFSGKLSTYSVSYAPESHNVITTIDGTEHFGRVRWRPSITFSLRPLTDAENKALFDALANTNTVVFTDPDKNTTTTAYMRFTSNVLAKFGLSSVDGNRYYKGGQMTLRGISAS